MVRVERQGPVTTVVLDRPEAANGMNDTLTRELAEAAALCDEARAEIERGALPVPEAATAK